MSKNARINYPRVVEVLWLATPDNDIDQIYYNVWRGIKTKFPKLRKKNNEKTPVGLDYLVNLGQEI